jgi:hypothetical protein
MSNAMYDNTLLELECVKRVRRECCVVILKWLDERHEMKVGRRLCSRPKLPVTSNFQRSDTVE